MKRFQIFLPFLFATAFTPFLNAQNLVGSTTLDIDPSTNIVTATCESDIDDFDYEPDVQCSVYDGAGNRVAAQGDINHAGSSAQVVLTFQGELGTNYTAIGSHIAISNITDLPEGPGHPTYYEDYYNYSSFEQGGTQTYPDYYDWYGPGPDVQIRNKNIQVGNTTKSGAIAPTITLAFTGLKNTQDNLMFSAGGTGICSEILGLLACPTPPFLSWNLEVNGAVKDDASKWTVKQSVVSGNVTGNTIDGNGTLYPFALPQTAQDDSPLGPYLQQTAGSKNIFWLDSPGVSTVRNGQPIDSMTFIINFSGKVCSTISTSVCSTANWYVKLILTPGGHLDTTNSTAALGTANF